MPAIPKEGKHHIKNIAGRLPEKLRKNRPACHLIEIETHTDLKWKKNRRHSKKLGKKHSATN